MTYTLPAHAVNFPADDKHVHHCYRLALRYFDDVCDGTQYHGRRVDVCVLRAVALRVGRMALRYSSEAQGTIEASAKIGRFPDARLSDQ